MGPSIVFVSLFIVIFGIAYLYFSTRHKERLALIEKDKDVSMFFSKKESKTSLVWRLLVLNLALISIGVGLGVLLGSLLHDLAGMRDEVAFPASIFLLSGVGLLIGFFVGIKMDKEKLNAN